MTRVLAADSVEVLTEPIVLGAGDGGVVGAIPGRGASLQWTGAGHAIVCGPGFNGTLSDFKLSLGANSSGIKIGSTLGSAQVYASNIHVSGGLVGWECVAAQICTFINIWSSSSDIGWKLAAGSANVSSHVIGGSIVSNRIGILVEHAIGCSFDRVAIQHNSEEGVLVDPPIGGVREFRIEKCHVEKNNDGRAGTGHGQIRVENRNNSLSDVRIRGGTFNQPGAGSYHCVIATGANVDAADYWNGGGDFFPFDQSTALAGGAS